MKKLFTLIAIISTLACSAQGNNVTDTIPLKLPQVSSGGNITGALKSPGWTFKKVAETNLSDSLKVLLIRGHDWYDSWSQYASFGDGRSLSYITEIIAASDTFLVGTVTVRGDTMIAIKNLLSIMKDYKEQYEEMNERYWALRRVTDNVILKNIPNNVSDAQWKIRYMSDLRAHEAVEKKYKQVARIK